MPARRARSAALIVGAASALVLGAWALGFLPANDADAPSGAVPPSAEAPVPGTADLATVPRRAVLPRSAAGRPTATLPQGGTGTPATSTVSVAVRDETGQPYGRGLRVTAVLLAGDGTTEEASAEAVTDDSGHAAFDLPPGRAVRFVVRRAGGEAARLDWRPAPAAPARPVLALVRRPSLVVRVRRDGVPTLPRAFTVTVDGRPLDVRETQAEEGIVIGAFEANDQFGPHVLSFAVEGGPTIVATLPPEEEANLGRDVTLDLAPAGPALRVEVRPSAGGEAPVLFLQRWDGAAWAYDRVLRVPAGSGARGALTARVEGLPAGRYRLLDPATSRASDDVTLQRGGPSLVLRLDLGGVPILRGRVEAPEGFERAAEEIWLFDPATSEGGPHDVLPVTADGTFAVPLPGDREVRVEARHPLALPGAPGSAVTLREPREGLVLRLEPGPTASVRLLGPDGKAVLEDVVVTLRARGSGPVPSRARPVPADGEIRFGGFAPGRYDVLFDRPADASLLLLERVDLGNGAGFLGTHALTSGRSIRLRALKPEGMAWPALGVLVELVDPAWPLLRPGTVNGGEGRVTGLLPGRYRVRFHREGGLLPPAVGVEQTVEVTDTDEPVVTIDFRPEAREGR